MVCGPDIAVLLQRRSPGRTVECNAASDEQWWVDYDESPYVNLVNYSVRKAIQCRCNDQGELLMLNPDLGNFSQMFRAINV